MTLQHLGKPIDAFHLARKSPGLESMITLFRLRQWKRFEVDAGLDGPLSESEIRPPPAFGQSNREIDRLPLSFDRDPDPFGLAGDFVVMILKVAKRPDRRSVQSSNKIAWFHSSHLSGVPSFFHNESLGYVQTNAEGCDIWRTVHVCQLVELALLLTLNVLIVSDQMTLDAGVPSDRSFHQPWNLARKQRLGTLHLPQFALLVPAM